MKHSSRHQRNMLLLVDLNGVILCALRLRHRIRGIAATGLRTRSQVVAKLWQLIAFLLFSAPAIFTFKSRFCLLPSLLAAALSRDVSP